MSKGDGDLADVHVTSGVNDRLEGFVVVTATSGSGRFLVGQLEPDVVRGMALQWLEAAEAAEQDAAVMRVLRKLELPDELAGAVVVELRNSRSDG
jgi:hypothetical protein